MTDAIKDASIAMGEDFGEQLPLIIKAIKQLNPAILDNIGVTVRLDKVNQRIKNGYYGLNTEINEATQQNAIFNEIMKQTAQFRGQEEALLKTNKGAYMKLTAEIENAKIVIGELFTEGSALSGAITFLSESLSTLTPMTGLTTSKFGSCPTLFLLKE